MPPRNTPIQTTLLPSLIRVNVPLIFIVILLFVSCGENANLANDTASTKPWDTAKLYGETVVNVLESSPGTPKSLDDTQTVAYIAAIPSDNTPNAADHTKPPPIPTDPKLPEPTNFSVKILEADYSKGEDDKQTPGDDYRQFALIPGGDTSGKVSESPPEEITVTFRVSVEWMTQNGINPADITLWQYNNKWVSLPTKLLNLTPTVAVYESPTYGFSRFAITNADTTNENSDSKVEFSTLPRRIPTKEGVVGSIPVSIEGHRYMSSDGSTGESLSLKGKSSSITLNLFTKSSRDVHGEVTIQINSYSKSAGNLLEFACSKRISFVQNGNQLALCSFEITDLSDLAAIDYVFYTASWNGVVFADSRPEGKIYLK